MNILILKIITGDGNNNEAADDDGDDDDNGNKEMMMGTMMTIYCFTSVIQFKIHHKYLSHLSTNNTHTQIYENKY